MEPWMETRLVNAGCVKGCRKFFAEFLVAQMEKTGRETMPHGVESKAIPPSVQL